MSADDTWAELIRMSLVMDERAEAALQRAVDADKRLADARTAQTRTIYQRQIEKHLESAARQMQAAIRLRARAELLLSRGDAGH